MSSKYRQGNVSVKRRTATAQDLRIALEHAETFLEPKAGLTSHEEKPLPPLPPQEPRFLKDIPGIGMVYDPQEKATKKLKKIIEENYYSAAFESAIKTVSTQRIPELDRIHTLCQFYYYIDQLVKWIPEVRVWDWNGEILHERTDYLRITQFYYYFNQPELEALQSPVAPVKGDDLSPISAWLREFAVEWGAFLGTEESKQYIESYRYAPEYNWQDYQIEPGKFKSFNDFFARQFKDIDNQRPVAMPHDPHVIVFPAESTFVGQWQITTGANDDPLQIPPSIVVKHINWPIAELLKDSAYAKDFEGGILCHSFLNTYDYHRLHTPVQGKVLEAKFIPGQVYLEVELENLTKEGREDQNPDLARAVIPRRYLDADDPTGYQFVQCRGLLVLDSPIGKVAVLPMGMAQVSSVVFVDPQKNNEPIVLTEAEKKECGYDYHKMAGMLNKKIKNTLVDKTIILDKGAMFSYFQFGGSDCVVVFERRANINVTATVGTHYSIRSQYAISNIAEPLKIK
ncbi:MAG TPA: phosphatidylserine decarboxylase [Candidatus Kapabacteria bacterium]|nr:phosphatidylserine decarboxylase [Candidatus Kapabacteria bacterium]